MSLATRCPACGTVFRVVSDQLKVSEGWVRCGRCAEVFNAAQQLFDLEPDAARADSPVLAPPAAGPGPAEAPVDADDVALPEPLPAVAAAAAAEAAPTPEFIRRADHAERWRRPVRRGALAAAAGLLAALLAGQMALHYRDTVAVTWPETRPALLAVCKLLDCRIDAPRRIDSLNVDSSGLVRLQDSPWYSLSLVVQNKAPTAVRMPAIDLALTDTLGHTVVRRVFTAAELGQPSQQLPGGAELALQATLDLGERRIAGYTVELFYP